MNALEQYIQLYREHAETVNAHGAPALNALRTRALEALEKAGRLPDKSDEGFSRTSVNDMFAPDFGVNIKRVAMGADVAASFHCGVPNLSTLMAVVANDRFMATNTLRQNLPEGVTVCSLKEAAVAMPEVVEKYYGHAADMQKPGTALNTLLVQDGVFVHVAAGVQLERAIQVVSILNCPQPMLAVRRFLVVVERGAKVDILKCDHTQSGSAQALSSEVCEIFAAEGARVGWYDIEESDPTTGRYCQVYARQERDSQLNVCAATLTNGTTRNEFVINLDGQHTETSLHGMAIGSGKQSIDNSSQVYHHADAGHSRQLFKYVLDDDASGAFEGDIEVCRGARFVEAYQNNRNMLASKGARMHATPTLLIYNDDVKCSHGSATGQLDANALFYMRTRGIPESTARRMLMQAFMSDVVDAIALEPLRDRMRHLVECRFAGEISGCQTCRNAAK